MSTVTQNGENERLKKLVKEAFRLSSDIAKADRQIEAQVAKENGKLVTWWESLDKPQQFVLEKGKDKLEDAALKAIFHELFRLLKISTKFAGPAAEKTLYGIDMLVPMKNNNALAKVIDNNPKKMQEYYEKKDRLQQVYTEIFFLAPPKLNLQSDICAREKCWQSR
jgi:hypothetical protein